MREKNKPEEDLGRRRPKAQTPIKKVSGALDLLHSMVTAAHNMVPCMQKLLRKKNSDTLIAHTQNSPYSHKCNKSYHGDHSAIQISKSYVIPQS